MNWRGLSTIAASLLLLAATSPSPAPVADEEIRATFVGKAACPPKPWPVSFGPYEFRADGAFFRAQDLAPWSGRYTIASGQICISPPSARADAGSDSLCFDVLKDDTQYFLRAKGAQVANASAVLLPVTPCPLPE